MAAVTMVMGVALAGGVVGAPAASAASVSVSVGRWFANGDTGEVSFEVSVTGERCTSSCGLKLRGYAMGGDGAYYPVPLGSRSISPGPEPFAADFSRGLAPLRQVDYIVADLVDAQTGGVRASSAPVAVASYPAAASWLRLERWIRDPAVGRVDYRFSIHGRALARVGQVCEVSCRWKVSGITDAGAVNTLASSSTLFNKWFLEATYSSPSSTLPVFAKLQFRIYSLDGLRERLYELPLPRVSDDPTQSVIDSYGTQAFAALLGTYSASEVCTALGQVDPISLDSNTVSDVQQVCEQQVLAGASLTQILNTAAAGAVAGSAILDGVVYYLGADGPPPTSSDPPQTDVNDQPVADVMKTNSRDLDPQLSDDQWISAAAQCRRLVARALPLPGQAGGVNPCMAIPTFFPGGDVHEAAEHDFDAIVAHPKWVMLNYVPRTTRQAAGLSLTWYANQPGCLEDDQPAGSSCDEYPFYSSTQSGPGASLRWIDSWENSYEGGRLGNFHQSCGSIEGDPFLVIPMPYAGAPATTWSKAGCRK